MTVVLPHEYTILCSLFRIATICCVLQLATLKEKCAATLTDPLNQRSPLQSENSNQRIQKKKIEGCPVRAATHRKGIAAVAAVCGGPDYRHYRNQYFSVMDSNCRWCMNSRRISNLAAKTLPVGMPACEAGCPCDNAASRSNTRSIASRLSTASI